MEKKEKLFDSTNKENINGEVFELKFAGKEILNSEIFNRLIMSYATSYWSGAWKELLKNKDGSIQYGTYDANGKIYEETQKILGLNGVDKSNPLWPQIIWNLANEGKIFNETGERLEPFWAYDAAAKELRDFVLPTSEGGYGGEVALLLAEDNECAGFSAYCVGDMRLVDRRFPYDELVINGKTVTTSISEILERVYGSVRTGLFLDFAIAENYRGKKLGSLLFDIRLKRMIDLGADILVGRTIKTSPRQYFGNYIARGMTPFAFDPNNTNKAIFAAERNDIKERRLR